MWKRAHREYTRRYRERRLVAAAGLMPGAPLPDREPGSEIGSPPGRVVAAVQIELDAVGALESRPSLAACALAKAAILDNPLAITSQPAAARQLFAILDELPGSDRRGKMKATGNCSGTSRPPRSAVRSRSAATS